MHRFLAVLVETGGNVTAACKSIRISRTAAYSWRNADADFAAAWDVAMDWSTQALEDEAVARALTGRNRPVFYQGKVVGHIRERSDLLMMFMLKARRPNVYRDRIDIRPDGMGGPGGTAAAAGPLIEQIGAASAAASRLMSPFTIEPAPAQTAGETVPDDDGAAPAPAPLDDDDGA